VSPPSPRSARVRPVYDPWRDVDGTPVPVGAWVAQTEVDAGLGALRAWLGKRGRVLRRSATRLVVRFAGESELVRIRPHLVRVTGDGDCGGG
jgi:hypothetical protein